MRTEMFLAIVGVSLSSFAEAAKLQEFPSF